MFLHFPAFDHYIASLCASAKEKLMHNLISSEFQFRLKCEFRSFKVRPYRREAFSSNMYIYEISELCSFPVPNHINDTHIKELILYWKNSLKHKVGCFSSFSYVYTINLVLFIPLSNRCLKNVIHQIASKNECCFF